jgi:hypothetical protein
MEVLYICTFVHEVREYLYYCNVLFLTAGMLVCTRLVCWYAHVGCLKSVGNNCMNDYFRSRGLRGNPKKSFEDRDTYSHPYLFDKNRFSRFKSEITQQFFVKFCGKTIHDCLASLSLLLTFLLAVVPFCVACCPFLKWHPC